MARRPVSGSNAYSGGVAVWSERRRRGDPDQRLLAETELLRLVPAAEAEAGVPVHVAAVRPVAGDHPHQPPPQQPPRGRRRRAQAAALPGAWRTKRAICSRKSRRSSRGRPVTVASAAYISAYQLIWLRRIVGQ